MTKDTQNTQIFHEYIDHRTSIRQSIAFESTMTEPPLDTFNINAFAKIPMVGEYILSKDHKSAYRVVRHQDAEACGNRLKIIFVAEHTPIQKENSYGDKGVSIHVHNQKCTSHCIDEYYLVRPKGFEINATLL
jgi:hypothetical protein